MKFDGYADIGMLMPMSGLCRVGVGAVLDPGRPGTIRASRGVGAGPAPGAPGIVETGPFAGVVPRGPAHVIEGVGGPFDHVERDMPISAYPVLCRGACYADRVIVGAGQGGFRGRLVGIIRDSRGI